LLALGAAACSPDQVVGNAKLPPDIPDPTAVQTPGGAVSAYRGALAQFRRAFAANLTSPFVVVSGLLADELQAEGIGYPVGVFSYGMRTDSRVLPEMEGDVQVNEPYESAYSELQLIRGQGSQARGLLTRFAPDSLQALTGHLDALQGYAEIFLADLFCSGIPLSTVDYDGDFTLRPGSPTADVYQHAITMFDSALALVADSARILNLARVGKARALLALGRFAEAAQAVAEVPDDFQYAVYYVNQPDGRNFAYYAPGTARPDIMADREGGNGLDYISSHDPRTAATIVATSTNGRPLYRPAKYALTGGTPVVVASGVEARLIEAEAQLNGAVAGDWLTTLNTLRTNGTFTRVDTIVDHVDTTDVGGTPQVDTTYRYDTLWVAGTGGVAGLGPLHDPGTPDARVDLVFRERAFWLFLTGHRQGDMRRLIRLYRRNPNLVYPVGAYPGGTGRYGGEVDAPVPSRERTYNSLFHGCLSRGA
ncbi:MAG: hypothetical protein IRY91_01835, partial [Gemmatimonadaceae bacterium]|nr:hypothetical protein [Gemmatimonadaceae bacterium]